MEQKAGEGIDVRRYIDRTLGLCSDLLYGIDSSNAAKNDAGQLVPSPLAKRVDEAQRLLLGLGEEADVLLSEIRDLFVGMLTTGGVEAKVLADYVRRINDLVPLGGVILAPDFPCDGVVLPSVVEQLEASPAEEPAPEAEPVMCRPTHGQVPGTNVLLCDSPRCPICAEAWEEFLERLWSPDECRCALCTEAVECMAREMIEKGTNPDSSPYTEIGG